MFACRQYGLSVRFALFQFCAAIVASGDECFCSVPELPVRRPFRINAHCFPPFCAVPALASILKIFCGFLPIRKTSELQAAFESRRTFYFYISACCFPLFVPPCSRYILIIPNQLCMSTQIIIYSVQCALTFKSLERETEIAQYIGDVFSQDDILKKRFFSCYV